MNLEKSNIMFLIKKKCTLNSYYTLMNSISENLILRMIVLSSYKLKNVFTTTLIYSSIIKAKLNWSVKQSKPNSIVIPLINVVSTV